MPYNFGQTSQSNKHTRTTSILSKQLLLLTHKFNSSLFFHRTTIRLYANLSMSSPTIKLNSGHQMPLVGFGLWKVDNATCADTVYNAIKSGYRLFDGACGKFLAGYQTERPLTTHRLWQ